jgi:hypothetical protein
MRHLIPISGKDSLATALVQTTRAPDLDYELFFTDVGMELPEVYAWLDRVEIALGRKITRVGRPMEKMLAEEGMLPSAQVRFCTRIGKIKPMEQHIGKDETTVYFGIRADENRVGFVTDKKNIHPIFPLIEMGIDLQGVYAINTAQNLKPPAFFWQRLYNRVAEIVEGDEGFYATGFVDLVAKMPVWLHDSLFAWRSRSNCAACFFQRRYEWVGLLEHYPDLFRNAQRLEREYGNNRQETPYYWIAEGVPLARVEDEQERIFEQRAQQVYKAVCDFSRNRLRMGGDPADMLSLTSCGLFCGK